MTTKRMSNHKPYLQFSRTETSLYLEAFVKHTRFMHLLVGGVFFFPQGSWSYSHGVSVILPSTRPPPLGLHKAHQWHPGAAKPQALTYHSALLNSLPLNKKFACYFGASPRLSINFPELNTLQATFRLLVVSSPPSPVASEAYRKRTPCFPRRSFYFSAFLPDRLYLKSTHLIICATAEKAPGVISH